MGNFLKDTYVNLNTLLSKHAQFEQTADPLIEDLAAFCVEKMTANYIRVWLLDQDGENLVLKVAGTGERDNYIPSTEVGQTLPFNDTNRQGKVLLEGKTYMTDDAVNDPLEADPKMVKEGKYVGYAAHPLMWGGLRLGVLDGYSRDPLPEDLDVMLATFLHLLSAIVYQQRSTESFCEASGLPMGLVMQMIRVGRGGH
jgi:hypothetical protein